ncbi:LysM peptidoglycan-binding domain-containing protein [uncultured Lutibacter sp.]|uniref:amino acid ABC transporter substrate-binding protein n=1 Tax=uncultured Lutibacter sp. TaxID=437739 RepID=UPI00262F7353|nr:LysM peptidoglycan-binding domain-containing protein [uncultured Lutibacter sp.]
MKKNKFLLLFLLFSVAIVFAQQKKYVSYTVKKGETLRSIAKEYDLSKRDLKRLNPGVDSKPEPKTIIIVPNKNFGKTVVEIIEVDNDLYTVQPKETLYGISKKFGVTIDELKAANLELENGVKIGMKLVIPNQSSPTDVNDSINYLLHTVIKDDTVYNLTKRYQVTAENLLKLNPILSEGLKLGMLLKIKPKEILEEEEEGDEDDEDYDEIGIFKEQLNFDKELNVVIMLPYQLNKITDSIRDISFGKGTSLLNITTDFHLGAKMAIDSLRQKGLKINVQYLDTENSNYKLQYLVNTINFKSTDVVIGPLFFDKAYWVAKHIKTPVMAPVFSKKQDSLSTNNLIKTSPNLEVYENKLLNYMRDNYNGETIVIVNDEKPENQSKLWRIVNKIKAFDSIQKVVVIKPKDGFIKSEIFSKKLDTLSKNWVFIISDEIVTTAAAVNNLKTYAADVDIRLFALNKGSNFDNIENSFLGKLNFAFPTSETIGIRDRFMMRFNEKYKSTNFAFPTKYAIRGFDVTYDTLIRIASSDSFENGLTAGASSRLSSVFNYDKKIFGSFENTGVVLIQYTKDLEILKLE